MRPRFHRVTWLGLIVLAGCQQPPDISDDLETYADLVSDANSLICECPEILGYASVAECDEVLSAVGLGEHQCLAKVLDGHEEPASEYLVCANAAYRTYVDCLEANVSCEESIYNACSSDHDSTLAACPQLPESVRPSFEACTD